MLKRAESGRAGVPNPHEAEKRLLELENEQLKQEVSRLNENAKIIENLKQENSQLIDEVKSLTEKNRAMSDKNLELTKEITSLRSQLKTSLVENKSLKLDQDELKRYKEKLEQLHKELIKVGYQQASNNQADKKPDIDFYAGIIDIPNISSLVEGWKISVNDWSEYQKLCKKPGTIVSVIGNYSKGKTFLLELLTGNAMPHGFNVNTQGISIVYLKDEEKKQRPIIALDTKGGGTPLIINNLKDGPQTSSEYLTEKLRDHGATEDLLQNFILEAASVIIIVVADLTFDDQKLINKISSKFKANDLKKIIVVHNLYHTHYVEDVAFKVQNSLLPSFNLNEVEFKASVLGKNDKYFIDNTRGRIPHVILAKQNTEAGDFYNENTLKYIKDNINSNDASSSIDIIQAFHEFMQNRLSDYIQADRPITLEDIKLLKKDDGQPMTLCIENINKIGMKAVFADVFGDLQIFKDGFRPNYTLYKEKKSEEEAYLCMKIECPDKCTNIQSRIEQSSQEFIIQVRGQKGDDCQSIPNIEMITHNRQFGDFFIETVGIKKSAYGIYYDRKPTKEYKDGMFILRWLLNSNQDPDWE